MLTDSDSSTCRSTAELTLKLPSGSAKNGIFKSPSGPCGSPSPTCLWPQHQANWAEVFADIGFFRLPVWTPGLPLGEDLPTDVLMLAKPSAQTLKGTAKVAEASPHASFVQQAKFVGLLCHTDHAAKEALITALEFDENFKLLEGP